MRKERTVGVPAARNLQTDWHAIRTFEHRQSDRRNVKYGPRLVKICPDAQSLVLYVLGCI
jgi:hypothetical protein